MAVSVGASLIRARVAVSATFALVGRDGRIDHTYDVVKHLLNEHDDNNDIGRS